MLKEEFEDRMGYHVTDEEFNRVNHVFEYSELDKDEFCTKLKNDPLYLAVEMSDQLRHAFEMCDTLRNESSRASILKTKNASLELKLQQALKALYIEACSYSDDSYTNKLLSQIREIGGINLYVNLILADKLEEGDLEYVMSRLE